MEHYLVVCLILVWSFCLQRSYSAESTLHYKLSNGEEISCVPIYEQPSLKSLDHDPYLMIKEATFIPSDQSTEEQTQEIPDATQIKVAAKQVFQTEVGSCPEGMIPILRNQGSRISQHGVDSINGKVEHKVTSTKNPLISDPYFDLRDHEYATTSLSTSGTARYFGGRGEVNLWNPIVEFRDEFSSARVAVSAGSYDQWNLNLLVAGMKVDMGRFGDNYTRLFVAWTRDAYHTTGCVNLECAGFVQTNSGVVIGGAYGTSVPGGSQYFQYFSIEWHQSSDAWWLQVGQRDVGYWPNSLLTVLRTGATKVEWGGEIINGKHSGTRHTQTRMGSGEFADARSGGVAKPNWQRAAWISALQTVDQYNQWVDAPLASLSIYNTKVKCYNAQKFQGDAEWRTHMYYGGPGYNRDCLT
ncbi:hypothetical protein R1sor_022054 [Riccia sorocarpa]|uniref:Neprosin PEP catalytic domain-containing protein n=1 Tax=Riccia sorocarpa TaxID=122646 RepID=A0ABD3GIS7_9MARC